MPTWDEKYRTPPARLHLDATGIQLTDGHVTTTHPLTSLDDPALVAKIRSIFGMIGLAEMLTARDFIHQPPPPPTGEACACGVQRMEEHHHLDVFEHFQDGGAPVEYILIRTRCRACGQCWTFEESGDSRYEYHYAARPFDPTRD